MYLKKNHRNAVATLYKICTVHIYKATLIYLRTELAKQSFDA